MRVLYDVSEISGFNDSPLGGEFITSGSRDFVAMKVVAASSVITNAMTGASGTVTSVLANRIDATGVWFNPGDFFYVTLDSNWTVQTDDGPVIDIECRNCGFSFPRKKLTDGLCKACIDDD